MSVKRLASVILGFSSYATAALTIAICVVAALTASINVPTFHLDGAFQTASGLFRLDSGQLPGRDFYPYLGVGPLLAIFPIYKIFGGDLAATVLAAKFLTIFLGWIAVSTLWHLVLRPANVLYSLAGGSLMLFGIDFIADQSSLPNLLAFGLEPGNSLRPVRAALPYMVAIFFYFLIKKIANVNLRNSLISATLGVALLWSNDFAIPTFGLFSLFVFFYFYCFEKENWVRNAAAIAAVSLLTWSVLLSFITAGHLFELLKYNFIDVARDQWWYFGPYGSNTRIFDIAQLSRLFSSENYFSSLVLFAVVLLAVKTRLIEYCLIAAIGFALFAGGSLASIGGHFGGYFGGFYFWGVTTSLVFCFKALTLAASRSKWLAAFRPAWLLIPTLLMIGLIAGLGLQGYKKKLSQAQADPNKFYVDELGGFLDVSFREYIDYARQHREHIAVEDYWGLWSSLNRSFPPWPVDSVIHALGSVREISRASLENTDLIITTRYLTSPEWQPWNLSQNYWFYDDLISNWNPSFTSPTTIVWKRSHDRSAFETTQCQVSSDKSGITLLQAAPGFFRVALGYSSAGVGRHLLMFRNNISYGGDAQGFVSLPPGAHEVTFPVLVMQEGGNGFDFKVIGEANAEISSCSAERIVYENGELLRVRKPEDFFLTDANWINGIARSWAGFFTNNTAVNRSKFKMGNAVTFANGEQRTIISVSENGLYLNVWVGGEILRPEDVGFPSKFEVAQ